MGNLTFLTRKVFSKLSAPLGVYARRSASRSCLAQMRSTNNEVIMKLASALESASNETFTNEQLQRFEKIEALRASLSQSQELIAIQDFGAGSATSHRTESEMQQGIRIERTVQQMCKSSTSQNFARLLFKIIYDFKFRSGVELGTCLGISASYQASAMEINNAGKFVTCEGSPSLAVLSRKNISTLEISRCEVVQGRFLDTYESVLKAQQPVDYAFIDGHHDEFATVKYFEQLAPYLSDVSIAVFDDISWSEGMERAWEKIKSMKVKGLLATVYLGKMGIVLIDRSGSHRPPTHYEYYIT